MSYGRLHRLDEDDRERLQLEAERIERIRAQVPEEEFDITAAVMIAREQIAKYCDNGK